MEKVARFFDCIGQSFFLLGPRGTGKSTMIKELFPDAFYLDLLLPDVFRTYLAHPERFREVVHGNKDKKVFVLDECEVCLCTEVTHYIREKTSLYAHGSYAPE